MANYPTITAPGELIQIDAPIREAGATIRLTTQEGSQSIVLEFIPAEYPGTHPGWSTRWHLNALAALRLRDNLAGKFKPLLERQENVVADFAIEDNVQVAFFMTAQDCDILLRCLNEIINVSNPDYKSIYR